MKYSILILLTAVTLTAATAQIKKGAWMLGATTALGYNSFSFKDGSNLSILNTNAKAGYFLTDNLAVGANFGFSSISQSITETTIILGVFSRYYFPKNIFLGAGVNSVSTSFSGGSLGSMDTQSIAIPFELGVAVFLTKNIAFEPSLNYTSGGDKGGVTMYGQNTGASSSLGMNFGFTLYLNRD